jgi:hypothetical protein
VCLLPEIVTNPLVLFQKIDEYGQQVSLWNNSLQTLELGSVIIGKTSGKANAINLPIIAKNHNAKVYFYMKQECNAFSFDPSILEVPLVPSASEANLFSLYASPKTAGPIEDMAIICIKDNPSVFCFKINVIGV